MRNGLTLAIHRRKADSHHHSLNETKEVIPMEKASGMSRRAAHFTRPLSPGLILVVAILAIAGSTPLLSARADVFPVKIVVEPAKGEIVHDAYVALVPPDRPWGRPADEKISDGASVVLEVPEGEYWIVAGVRGHGVKITDAITVGASGKNDFRVALPAMRAVTGTVRDEQGKSLPDVTIGHVRGFVEAPLGRASELAARYFDSDWRTKSAPDGSWSLLLPADAINPIVAESRAYATTWWSQEDGLPGPLELVMQRGAVLQLALDREAPEFVVTLTAKGDTSPVPAAWQAQFWGHRVLQPSLEWSSLPAGEYDIYAQQWDPRTFSDPVKLATVTLQSGDTRELRVELPRTKAPSRSVATVLVRPVTQLDATTIEAFGRDRSGAPRPVPSISEKVSGGTLLYLDTAGFSAPYFGTASDDRFLALPVREDGKYGIASVRDLGGARLRVQTGSESLGLPISGMASFHGCLRSEPIAVPLAVSKGGEVTFPAPAGCTSFVLDFDPFSPLVFPKQLSSGDPEWLGDFTLYASGRAAVRVATDDGSGVADAIVSVSTRTDGGPQASVPVAQRTTGPDGWARFDRLPAGRELVVVARTTDGDRSITESLRAEPTQEKIIDPLTVPKAANLVVEPELDPGFIEQFPDGRILAMFLEPLDRAADRLSARVGESGRVEFNRLLPGRWQLGAMISTGQGAQPVLIEEVEMEAGESKRIEPLIKPLVFRGRVSGNIPDLSGNIDILSSKRSDSVPSVGVSSSGEFLAILPRRGSYYVGVRPRSTGQMIWVGNTPFADPSQHVEVRLPEGVIVARVSADGQPLAGAMVMARMQYQPTTDVPLIALPVRTGEDGQARIEGLLPGQWTVFVSKGGQAQKSVSVSSAEAAYADLDVTSGLAITGTVTETFGIPVPGARVMCILPGPDGVPHVRMGFTASDGSFDMEERVVSRSTVLCSVTSASGAQGYRVVAGEHARLVLPSNPATLHVTSLPAMDRFSSLWLVSRDGRLIEVSPYVPRVAGAPALTIPALASEGWKLVRVSTLPEWMALTMGGGALPAIVDVTLIPGEKKTVELEPRS